MEKRIDQMTDEELRLAEDAALNVIQTANRTASTALNRVRDIHVERFQRECVKPKRKKK